VKKVERKVKERLVEGKVQGNLKAEGGRFAGWLFYIGQESCDMASVYQ